MNKMKKLISIGAVVLVVALLLTLAPACGKEKEVTPTPGGTPTPGVTPTPTPEVKTLKIGALCALSGPAAPWGSAHELGIKWAAEDINAAGGLKVGPDTYMLKVVSCDAKYIGSVAAECATRFIHVEKAKYVFGGIGTTRATVPIFTEAKVINIGLGTGPPVSPEWPYYLNGNMDPFYWLDSWVQLCSQQHPEWKTLALINPNAEGGYAWADAQKVAAPKYGQTVVADEYYEYGTVDFYPVLTPIVAKNPDAISLGAAPAGEGTMMTKQLRELGYTGWIQHPAPIPVPLMKASMPTEYLYNIATEEEDFSSPVFAQSVRDLHARWLELYAKPGETMNTCTVHGYGHVMTIAAAIEQAGSIDVDEVLKVFDDPDFRFNRTYVENAKMGGLEAYGIRRQIPTFQSYSEIQDGVLTIISGRVIDAP